MWNEGQRQEAGLEHGLPVSWTSFGHYELPVTLEPFPENI